MRVVLDTNILVSASITPQGASATIVELALAGVLFPILSADVLLEYEEVLARPKFLRQLDRSAILLEGLKEVSTLVHPADPLTVCADEGDNRILECALAGVAEFVITGT